MTNEARSAEHEPSTAEIISRHKPVEIRVSMDQELVEQIREEVGDEGVADYVTELVKEDAQRRAVHAYEEIFLRESGPFSEDDVQWADAQIRKAGWEGPAWRGDEGE
ncbi:MAG: hypothetical protein M0026_10950 [Nocardiopsaceae bacterium]|nr:hypothetical protein [Nocardiopsaceae bacterium]